MVRGFRKQEACDRGNRQVCRETESDGNEMRYQVEDNAMGVEMGEEIVFGRAEVRRKRKELM